jgi:hypothetical protein
MMPIDFPGAKVIGKPESMTDEQCSSIYAMDVNIDYGKDAEGNDVKGRMWVEAWKPSKEDIEAINRGEPIWLQIHSNGLPPVAVFTVDEKGEKN